MAIGTPVSLGTTADAGTTNPYTLTTTAVVPSGALVVLATPLGADTPATGTVTGGGLAWTEDTSLTGIDGTADWDLQVWSAPAPSGLASSTVLSLAWSGGTPYSGVISCFYITGVSLEPDRVNMVDGQFRTGPTANWDSTASSTTLANVILIGAAFRDDASAHTSVATGSATEIHDFESADAIGLTTTYRIVSSTGSYGATGTWSGVPSFTDGAVVVAYKSSEYDVVWEPEVDSLKTMHVVAAPRL